MGALLCVVMLGVLTVRLLAHPRTHSSGPAAQAADERMNPVAAFTPQPVLAPHRTAPLAPHPDPALVSATLDQIFTGDVLAHAGLAVVAEDGTTLFVRNAQTALAPASTLKLLVASTALNLLGPRHRFLTEIVAESRPVDGTIPGSLWLVGSGDPLFSRDDLEGGVGVLARSGLRHVGGDVVVDGSDFRGPELNPNWDPDDLQYGYAAASSAVSLDQGTIEFDVIPTSPGAPAEIRVIPTNRDVRVSGTITTASSSAGTLLHIYREDDVPGHIKPDNAFDVDGYVAYGDTQKYWQPVHHLVRYAGFALLSSLLARNIAVDGSVRVDSAPLAAQTLWAHRSQPLDEIVRDMLVNSNNHTAEQLLRIVGAQVSHVGTVATGAGAERAELVRLNVPVPGLHILDGSGLSPQDRIAATTLAHLVAAELQTPEGDRFLRGLPRVGMEGTVWYHQLHDALGKARAKSGHIENVNALAGTVQTTHHGRVAFAFIVNDPDCNADIVTNAQDQALDAIARL
ncbi:MAG TPA: D-alanyl-D-alanine carboxypeptidase/D-alanyl-D-alanine-endopeptidase [Candidatus Baltobacteraceae bacterium]